MGERFIAIKKFLDFFFFLVYLSVSLQWKSGKIKVIKANICKLEFICSSYVRANPVDGCCSRKTKVILQFSARIKNFKGDKLAKGRFLNLPCVEGNGYVEDYGAKPHTVSETSDETTREQQNHIVHSNISNMLDPWAKTLDLDISDPYESQIQMHI